MTTKYERPSYFPKKEWDDLTNITANPNGPRAMEKAAEFNSIKDIVKHRIDLEQKNNLNIPINKINAEMLIGLQADPEPIPLGKLSFTRLINPRNIFDIGLGLQAMNLFYLYEDALTNNYNKLPRKSQSFGIKEAVNALAPIPAGNANIVNQSPLTIGIPQ